MSQSNSINRRVFLWQGLCATGLLKPVVSGGQGLAATGSASSQGDVPRYFRTDPKLLNYSEVGRFKSAHANPRRLAIAPGGRIFIAAGKYVSAVDEQGIVQLEIALPSAAGAIAFSKEGEIYVGLQAHIEVFDAKGRHRKSWENAGARSWITAIAVTPEAVFAADAGNRRVLRYDPAGKLLGSFGQKNSDKKNPGFIVPSPFFDVKVHRDGLLRISNPGRHRVEAYTTDGDFEFAWGKPSAAIDSFCGCCNPIAIAPLPDGRMVTCEKGLPRVKIYDRDGVFQSVVAGAESFPENREACSSPNDCRHGGLDAVVDAAGRVLILDLVRADVRVMAPKAGGAVPNSAGKGA